MNSGSVYGLCSTGSKEKRSAGREKPGKKCSEAVLDIKKKYGKNAVLKGMSLIEGATAVARNRQIGGHKA